MLELFITISVLGLFLSKNYSICGLLHENQYFRLCILRFSGTTSSYLSLNPGVLTPGQGYSLHVSVTSGVLSGFAEFSFITSLPPYGGACSISPSKGMLYNTLIYY